MKTVAEIFSLRLAFTVGYRQVQSKNGRHKLSDNASPPGAQLPFLCLGGGRDDEGKQHHRALEVTQHLSAFAAGLRGSAESRALKL